MPRRVSIAEASNHLTVGNAVDFEAFEGLRVENWLRAALLDPGDLNRPE